MTDEKLACLFFFFKLVNDFEYFLLFISNLNER